MGNLVIRIAAALAMFAIGVSGYVVHSLYYEAEDWVALLVSKPHVPPMSRDARRVLVFSAECSCWHSWDAQGQQYTMTTMYKGVKPPDPCEAWRTREPGLVVPPDVVGMCRDGRWDEVDHLRARRKSRDAPPNKALNRTRE